MFTNALLDLFFGVALIYFFLSLLCSAVLELIAGVFQWRAIILRDSLKQMLGSAVRDHLYLHPLIRSLCHQTDKGKMEAKYISPRYPSYIPPQLFAIALLDTLADFAKAPTPVSSDDMRGRLLSDRTELSPISTYSKNQEQNDEQTVRLGVVALLDDRIVTASDDPASAAERLNIVQRALNAGMSPSDLLVVQDYISGQPPPDNQPAVTCIAAWYGYVMERATGSYKRKVQVRLVGTALILCIGGNISFLRICRTLWTDNIRRAVLTRNLTTSGSGRAGNNSISSQMSSTAIDSAIPFPFGWSQPLTPTAPVATQNAASSAKQDQVPGLSVKPKDAFVPPIVGRAETTTTTVTTTTTTTKPIVSAAPSATNSPTSVAPPAPVKSPAPAKSPAPTHLLTLFSKALDWIVGILLSVIALTLGAPFWFNILTRITNIRSSGGISTASLGTTPSTPLIVSGTSSNDIAPTSNATVNPALKNLSAFIAKAKAMVAN